VSPLRGEKPQNWPLSKLNTGRFALRAMLPVNIYNIRKYSISNNMKKGENEEENSLLMLYLCTLYGIKDQSGSRSIKSVNNTIAQNFTPGLKIHRIGGLFLCLPSGLLPTRTRTRLGPDLLF